MPAVVAFDVDAATVIDATVRVGPGSRSCKCAGSGLLTSQSSWRWQSTTGMTISVKLATMLHEIAGSSFMTNFPRIAAAHLI